MGDLQVKQQELALKAQEAASRRGEDPQLKAMAQQMDMQMRQQTHNQTLQQSAQTHQQKMAQAAQTAEQQAKIRAFNAATAAMGKANQPKKGKPE
jgi:hypothetical protein